MLKVENISFGYSDSLVLKNISFQAKKGEHISIIGESGSGKSTLLKLLYGEHDLNEGKMFWKDEQILGPKFNLIVGQDYIKYVAQEFDLDPFKTVQDNIGTFLSPFYPRKKKKRIQELLEVVELQEYAETKVNFLSGGQKQRVAIAKAMAETPEIIILDEPFSHIDNFKKQSLRRNLFSYLKEKKIACIVATHDKDDVLGFSDSMIVLNNAQIIANDSPEVLYNDPKTPLVASFFGEFNIINSQIVYANQLKMVDSPNLKTTVNKSYFHGQYFLIEANLNGEIIYFEHDCELEKGKEVYLKITKL